MYQVNFKIALSPTRRRALKCSFFERIPTLFYLVTLALLALLALALVHELIPGLCAKTEDPEATCVFCEFVKVLGSVLFLVYCLLSLPALHATVANTPNLFPGHFCRPQYHLRVPPAC